MTTSDLIESLRADILRDLKEQTLAELKPEIERRLYGNVFNFKQAMKYLHLSDSTLRREVAEGKVPYFYQRGQLFFRQASLDRHMDELEREEQEKKAAMRESSSRSSRAV